MGGKGGLGKIPKALFDLDNRFALRIVVKSQVSLTLFTCPAKESLKQF